MENELNDARRKRRRKQYEKCIDNEYAVLHKKLTGLKEESAEMLLCSVGDGKFADRVQQHLAETQTFFGDQMSTICSADTAWSARHKTRVLEKLKDAFVRNVSKMDEWVDLLIEINKLPALD